MNNLGLIQARVALRIQQQSAAVGCGRDRCSIFSGGIRVLTLTHCHLLEITLGVPSQQHFSHASRAIRRGWLEVCHRTLSPKFATAATSKSSAICTPARPTLCFFLQAPRESPLTAGTHNFHRSNDIPLQKARECTLRNSMRAKLGRLPVATGSNRPKADLNDRYLNQFSRS